MDSGLFVAKRGDGPSDAIRLLGAVVAEHGPDLVALFYDTLLQDEEATRFLSHAMVHERLSKSLLVWLTELFGDRDIGGSPELQERQRTIGQVHARIRIPIHLVMQGAIAIKSRIAGLLAERPVAPRLAMNAAKLANERVDTAIMLMSQAYMKDTTARARLDEAYRLFSLDQDVAIEKEAQKASLMEWSHKTLFSLLRGQGSCGLDPLSRSPFGLWVRHRAEFMFGQSDVFQSLVEEIAKVDSVLLPQLEEASVSNRQQGILAELQAAVDRIAYLIGELFQALTAMENGRDPLTRALSRRFLPAILSREIGFAAEHGSPLTAVLLDVDHFKSINDRYGHQVGDTVLRQVAQLVVENVRPSDFLFRYGGEEFLILLAETPVEEAHSIAERVRSQLEQRPIDTGAGDALRVTASFGIAGHNGHPDQKYLIGAADEALYRAKANGRNRVEIGG